MKRHYTAGSWSKMFKMLFSFMHLTMYIYMNFSFGGEFPLRCRARCVCTNCHSLRTSPGSRDSTPAWECSRESRTMIPSTCLSVSTSSGYVCWRVWFPSVQCEYFLLVSEGTVRLLGSQNGFLHCYMLHCYMLLKKIHIHDVNFLQNPSKS